MKNSSIIKKQMILYVLALVTCAVALCAVLSVVYTQRYMDEKKDKLIAQGTKITAAFVEAYETGEMNNLSYELQVLEEYMDASVAIVNNNGMVVLCSPLLGEALLGEIFEYEEILDGMGRNNIVTMSSSQSTFTKDPILLVGYPMSVGQMSGIVMIRSTAEMQESLYDMYFAGLIGVLVIFAFSILAGYGYFKRMIQPITDMNAVAKEIAGGNFEKRVEIRTNDELGELAESFNHMAESLENNDKTRRDFIGNVSHDLRSPLTSMQGFLTALLDGTIPPEKQERYLQIVLEETYRLSRLTEGIGDLNRAESSCILLDLEDFDINALIRENITIFEPQLNEKKMSIKAMFAEQKTIVSGDRDKISRVVQNLMSNAIKFSDMEAVIEVETTLTERNKVLVSIKDYGAGISTKDQKYVFDRFYKGDPTRNLDKHGSGIGLAIVRDFMQAHGEKVTMKSVEGEGTTFIFTLQLAE
ncbi:HAMP domain-containing sensor histidine kinase [Chakrabartyella piscis]|uniref:sensor histidine kinase n=1 Tax=Chakrabartyella piscis TaxID=2918914 RepID=UPI002958B7F7|nr:HAMP domain-containing sensor histidine kinase [Chakrabartyella piscis]